MMLPMSEGAPAPGWRTILRPNGQSAKAAILNCLTWCPALRLRLA